MREAYAFTREPRGPLLRELLTVALGECRFLGLISQAQRFPTLDDRAQSALDDAFLEEKRVTQWPGARLGGDLTATLRLFHYSPEVMSAVVHTSDSLFAWHNPDLPDDPHLLRSDGSHWMGSTTVHDPEVWLHLDPKEYANLLDEHPHLASSLQPGLISLPEDVHGRGRGGNGHG